MTSKVWVRLIDSMDQAQRDSCGGVACYPQSPSFPSAEIAIDDADSACHWARLGSAHGYCSVGMSPLLPPWLGVEVKTFFLGRSGPARSNLPTMRRGRMALEPT